MMCCAACMVCYLVCLEKRSVLQLLMLVRNLLFFELYFMLALIRSTVLHCTHSSLVHLVESFAMHLMFRTAQSSF